jgi:hypothetical protein
MCHIQCQRGYHAYPTTLTGKLIKFPLFLTELQVGIFVKMEQNKKKMQHMRRNVVWPCVNIVEARILLSSWM